MNDDSVFPNDRERDGGLQWRTIHTGPLEPWMQQEFDAFRASIDGLTSSDPQVAAQAFGDLMARDPGFYPAVVSALTEGADDATKAMIEESLQYYWEQYGGREERGPGGGGGGSDVTFEITGKVTTGPGSKVTIETLVGDFPIDVSGQSFPINVAESAHTCPRLVASSETEITGIEIPVSFTLPGYLAVTGIKVDLILIIDIKVIIRYYECKEKVKEVEQHGDRELVPQWDRVGALIPARF
ncbi:MAG: hypothetical protein IPK72_23865 [Candidatus Eisenbacteria bacterium]|nr:hypothetical protein [Candidatus Eisenbacteria bacterium]